MKSKTERRRTIRRDFIKFLTSVAGGLGIPGLLISSADAEGLAVESVNPLNTAYLEKGLNALARAHHMSSMAGHLGASLIAGYYIGEQRPNLDPEVTKGIEGDLNARHPRRVRLWEEDVERIETYRRRVV